MQGIPEIAQGQQPVSQPTTGPTTVPLTQGEVVRGEVINILPDAVSMRLKKEVLLAKTDIPLQKGESYLFRVESLEGGEIQLKVLQALAEEIDVASPFMLDTLSRLKGAYLTHEQLEAFQALFEKIPESVRGGVLDQLFRTFQTLPDGLKAALDSTGIFFETKLRGLILKWMEKEGLMEGVDQKSELEQMVRGDLKGTLLKMQQALSDPDTLTLIKQQGISPDEVSVAVDKLLAHIELQQFESKQNGAFQTFLPLTWKGLKDGKMRFQESYHPKEGGSEYACVIHLDLEKAGKLTAKLQLFSNMLHLRFVTDNARFRALIEEQRPTLETHLSEIGLMCSSFIVTQEQEAGLTELPVQGELDIRV